VVLDRVVAAIAPVFLILLLGFVAGKRKRFTMEQARGFSLLTLHYTLPVALFLGMAQFRRDLLMQQGALILVMIVGYAVLFPVAFWVLRAFGMEKLKAVLLGYTVASTATPIYGLTVLVPIFGMEAGTGVVGMAALVTNLAQVSVAIAMLAAASGEGDGVSAGMIFRRTVSNPLVLGPVLGALVSASGYAVPGVVISTLKPFAVAASGVAIFACGLALAFYPVRLLSRVVVLGSLACLVVQPVVFFGCIKLLGVGSAMAKATFVSSVMPTSTPTVLFAHQYRTCEAETASIMLVTTLAMVVTIPVCLVVCGWL